MNGPKLTLVVAGALVVITAFIFFIGFKPQTRSRPAAQNPVHSSPKRYSNPVIPSRTNLTHSYALPDEYPQISIKAQSRIDAVLAENERLNRDHAAQWKTPIAFYGVVEDENKQPVADATIKFEWNDLSAKGTSTSQTHSDAAGRFELSGVRGKGLSADVSKAGYYKVYDGRRTDFEFSMPAEESYYEPDASQPVVFFLRKKGVGAPLIERNVRITTPLDGTPARYDLVSGKASVYGEFIVRAWKPRKGTPFPFDWRFLLTIPGGGFAMQLDQFGFEAPTVGYSESLDKSAHTALPDITSVMEGKVFIAFGESRVYGRLEFRTKARDSAVYLHYFINQDGSTYLEPVPTE